MEQQRISHAASSGLLFADRAEMMAERGAAAAAYQQRLLKEQEKVVIPILE
jgi:hypothetical protein